MPKFPAPPDPKKDRQGKMTVALVGFASDSRELAPYDDLDVDIWTLNKAHLEPWMKRFDAYFQLHTKEYLRKSVGLTASDRKHWDWLCEPHDFFIFTQKKFEEMPASVEFPLDEAKRRFGDFYTSTLAYMMALAIMEGYERIELYGFNLAADSEYRYQRDSGEYFIGLAEGMGIEVYLPPSCPMVKGRLYGFGGSEIGLRQLYEFRVHNLTKELNVNKAKFQVQQGFTAKMQELVKTYPDLRGLLEEGMEVERNTNNIMQAVSGAKKEAELAIELFDKYFNTNGNGEIDKPDLAKLATAEVGYGEEKSG